MTLQAEAEVQVQKELITGEVLYQEGHPGRVELVQGEIVSLSPTGRLHGRIELKIGMALERFNMERNYGEVLVGETGVYTGRNPDTVRGMDVALISHEGLAQSQSQGFLNVAPELVVEVMSPSDRWSDVVEKLGEYFSIGVRQVWVVDPAAQQIYVYHSLTEVTILTNEDTLIGGELLPEFKLPVADLFST